MVPPHSPYQLFLSLFLFLKNCYVSDEKKSVSMDKKTDPDWFSVCQSIPQYFFTLMHLIPSSFFFCHLPAKRRRPYTSPGTLAISPPHTPLSSAASTIGWAIMWGTGRKSTKTSQNGAEVDKVGEGAYWHRAKCRTQIFSHRGRWYRLAWQSIFRHAFACKSRFHGGHRKLVLALMWMAFPTSFPFRSAPTILYFKT